MARRQTLVALTIDTIEDAKKLLSDLREYDKNSSDMTVLDAVFASKDSKGNISIQQTQDLDAGRGFVGGGTVGVIVGAMTFGPLGAAIGGTIGSVLAGLYASLRDSGMNNSMMKNVVRDLQPEHVALIMLYEGLPHSSMANIFNVHEATLFYTNLPVEAEDKIRTALNSPALTELATITANSDVVVHAVEDDMPDVYVEDDNERLAPVVSVLPLGMSATPMVAEAFVVPVKESVIHAKPDNLTRIKGVDTRIEFALKAANYQTYTQLARASIRELREVLSKSNITHAQHVATWGEQAWMASRGEWQLLDDLQAKLS